MIRGWCKQEFVIWKKEIKLTLQEGLKYECDKDSVIFNHYSFCEIIKHIMVKYGDHSYELANIKVTESWLMKVPNSIRDIYYLSHELTYHWAMIMAYGDLYWSKKGIPSNYNDFSDEFFNWRKETRQKYNLKEEYLNL